MTSIEIFFNKLQAAFGKPAYFHEPLWEILQPYVFAKRFRKNSCFSTNSYDAYVVESGILSLQQSDTQHSVHFITSGDIVLDCFLDPALEYSVLEEAVLIILPIGTLAEMHRKRPEFFYLQRDIVRLWLIRVAYRSRLLDLPKHERRAAFKKLFPDIPGRVSNILIARYLAMSREYYGKSDW